MSPKPHIEIIKLEPFGVSQQRVTSLLHLMDGDYVPVLSSFVDIDEYAKKLNKNAVVLLAALQGRDVGLLAVYVNDKKKRDAYISTIGVLREFQGLGVGSALIKSAIEVAALNAMKRVILEVSNGNVAAVNLYRKMGFIVRGQGGGKTYEGAIQMKKSI